MHISPSAVFPIANSIWTAGQKEWSQKVTNYKNGPREYHPKSTLFLYWESYSGEGTVSAMGHTALFQALDVALRGKASVKAYVLLWRFALKWNGYCEWGGGGMEGDKQKKTIAMTISELIFEIKNLQINSVGWQHTRVDNNRTNKAQASRFCSTVSYHSSVQNWKNYYGTKKKLKINSVGWQHTRMMNPFWAGKSKHKDTIK